MRAPAHAKRALWGFGTPPPLPNPHMYATSLSVSRPIHVGQGVRLCWPRPGYACSGRGCRGDSPWHQGSRSTVHLLGRHVLHGEWHTLKVRSYEVCGHKGFVKNVHGLTGKNNLMNIFSYFISLAWYKCTLLTSNGAYWESLCWPEPGRSPRW